jgi:membrane protein implicated in regulation of membrane protease activity
MTRQLLGLAGMLLAVLGLALESGLLMWCATALLVAAVAWRLLDSRRNSERDRGE